MLEDNKMQKIRIARWEVEHDPDATRAAYGKVTLGGADKCECPDCQYFRTHREKIYSEPLRTLLNALGIDYRKEVETTCVDLGGGAALYGSWFHFVGSILEGRDGWRLLKENVRTADFEPFGDAEVGITSNCALVPVVFPRAGILQFDFSVKVLRS